MNIIRKLPFNSAVVKLIKDSSNFFAIQSSQATIIKKPVPIDKTIYTREYYKLRNETPDYEKFLQQKDKEIKNKEIEQKFYLNKFNDKNTQNLIKVPVNHEIYTNESLDKSAKQIQKLNTPVQPFVIQVKPRPEKKLVSGLRKNIPTSIKRLFYPLRLIKRKHIYEAISISNVQKTKASKYVIQVLKQVMNHAVNKDMDPDRLYVQAATVGLQRRFKRMRYHAKGQHGIMQTKISQVRITLEEKPIKNMYKELLVGKTPPALAFKLREQFLKNNADYETLKKYSFVLTARGRQQKRMIFKRKVQLKYMDFKKKGVTVPKKMIAEKLLEEEATLWSQQYEKKRNDLNVASINKRTAIFKKNEEITG